MHMNVFSNQICLSILKILLSTSCRFLYRSIDRNQVDRRKIWQLLNFQNLMYFYSVDRMPKLDSETLYRCDFKLE